MLRGKWDDNSLILNHHVVRDLGRSKAVNNKNVVRLSRCNEDYLGAVLSLEEHDLKN